MKRLLLLLTLCVGVSAWAQFNRNAPWMKDFNFENRSTPIKFQEIVDAANTYFESIDKDAKGSGYKPFKRWEAYWQNFIDTNGYMPTSEDLWNTWLDKQNSNTRESQADTSNWSPLGPFSHVNTGSWSSGQGRVNSIIVDPNNPNTYYSGTPAGGIWKSTDAGQNWTILTDDLPQIGVSGIAIDYNNSNIIYIATGDDDAGDSYSVGVWKSTDGGNTWGQTGLNPNNSPSRMNDIYIHPTNSQILWVATNGGVYKSTNGGTSWTETLNGNIRDIKIKPGDPNTIYAVTSSQFYRSTNGGDSFSVVSSGLPNNSSRFVIDVTPANNDYVYVVSADGNSAYNGIYRSTDSGISFTQMANAVNIFESSQAWYDLALAVSDINPDEIYVGVLNVWKSSNGGDSFIKLNSWSAPFSAAYTHADIHLLRFYNGELYAGTDGGFYKTSDGGTNFTDLTEGMQIGQFYRVAVSQQTSTKMVGGLQDNGGFALNNNIWQVYYGADGMDTAVDPNNQDHYYGFTQFGGGLYISENAGASITSSFGGPASGNWITPMAMNSESELYTGYSSLYKFTGSGWQQVSQNLGINIGVLEIDDNNADNIFVSTFSTLRKSTDRGVNFTTVESFPTEILSIEINNNDSNIVYVTTRGSNGQVYRSLDGGNTFTSITGSLPSVSKNMIKHRAGDAANTLFLGTSLGVYRYDDNTAEWEEYDNGLPNTSVRDLELNLPDEKIIAATYGRGIWISDLPAAQEAQDDVRLVSVDNPDSFSINCGDLEPQITVLNNGQNVINTIDINYTIDGGTNNNFNWNGTLNPGASTIIDLPALTLPRGQHDIIVNIFIVNDEFPGNNQLGTVFYTNDTGIAQLINTFETPAEELLVFNEGGGTALWERGVPTGIDLNTASSGTQVYGTNLDGNHPDLTKAYLYSQCYNLDAIVDPILKFHMAFEIEFDWDLVYVEYTIDQGDTWSLLGSANDPNWYNSSRIAGDGIANNCFNCVGGQWTGVDTTMQEYSYALDALTNEESVIFRVVFHSDQSVNFEGVILDDFYVDGTLSISDFETNSIRIYPNPSNSIFNIVLNNIGTYNYNVTDITGKVVLKENNLEQRNYALDMSNFASGMYFLKITSQGRSITKKLVLK